MATPIRKPYKLSIKNIYFISFICHNNKQNIVFISKIKSYTISLQDDNMYKSYIWMNINSNTEIVLQIY